MGRGIKKDRKSWSLHNAVCDFALHPPIEKEYAFQSETEQKVDGSFASRTNLWEEETELGRFFLEEKTVMNTVRVYDNLEIREINGLHFIVEYHAGLEVVKPRFHLDFTINNVTQAENNIEGVIKVAIGRRPAKSRMIFNELIRDSQERKLRERGKC